MNEISENEVLMALENAGLEYKNGSRYILTQCPLHEDKHPSCQIYKDDWFAFCSAGCGRFPIQQAFEDLRKSNSSQSSSGFQSNRTRETTKRSYKPSRDKAGMMEHQYKQFDLMDEWKSMAELESSFQLHGVPGDVLNYMGWRYTEMGNSIFIPYFSASQQSIPFAQYRHLEGDRRFTMLKDAKPTCYGTWNLNNHKLFVVEGTSDCAVLEYAGVPWIGLPSAASKGLMKQLCIYASENDIELVYAGDKDLAGNQLKDVIEEILPYRIKQPPRDYKDWGEFLEGEGIDVVRDYAQNELYTYAVSGNFDGVNVVLSESSILEEKTLETIKKVWPEAENLTLLP